MNSHYDLLRTMSDDDLRSGMHRNARKAHAYEYLRCGAGILRELYTPGSTMHNRYSGDADSYRDMATSTLTAATMYEKELDRRGLLPEEGAQHEEEIPTTRTQMQDQEGEISEAGTWIVKGIQSYPHVKYLTLKKGDLE